MINFPQTTVINDGKITHKNGFLAHSSALLYSSLDARAIVHDLARLAVPLLGDGCIVDWRDGDELRRIIAAPDGAQGPVAAEPTPVAQALDALRDRGVRDGDPIDQVMTSCQALVAAPADQRWLESLMDATSAARLCAEGAPVAVMIVPLIVRNASIGTMTFLGLGQSRCFGESELALAQDLATRAALAVDNAHLFAAERQARDEAEAACRARDEFVATVSHELRTPLTSILGWITLVRTVEDDREAVQRALDIIERNARAQAKLIDDILDISRIITGQLRVEKQQFDLVGIVQAALEVVRPAAEARSIQLAADLRTRVMVMGDPPRMQQVVWNLLSNAIKFTPQRGTVTVSVGVNRGDEQAEILVRDNGQGITPEFLPRVFDRFSQADPARTRRKGLGLGLAIARHLVELHGGTISAASPGPNQGATFIVRLPLAPAASAGWPERKSIRLPPKLFGIRVLVAEDDPDTREFLEVVLEGYGAEVRVAASGSEALRILQKWRPNVLVSDLAMDDGDGFELIRNMRDLGPAQGGNIPALALTAYATVDDRVRVLGAGYQMHLPKPVAPEELARVIALLVQQAASLAG